MPERWKDRAPRVVRRPDGSDVWSFEGSTIPNIGLNAVAGRPKEEYGIEPTAFDEMRPAAGTSTSGSRTWTPAGCSGRCASRRSPGSRAGCSPPPTTRTWPSPPCGPTTTGTSTPGAARPRPLHPDGPARCCGTRSWPPRGAPPGRQGRALGLTFTENPATLGYPSFHHEHWDPLWRALCDTDTVLSIHLGSSGQLAVTSPDAPIDVMITLQPMNICQAAADLLWSRVLREFPDIRIALSEGGTGWIPYFLDRIDRTYDMHHLWTGQDFGDRRPSDVFRQHFLTCFIADPWAWPCATTSASTTSPGSATTPTATRRGPRPRGAGRGVAATTCPTTTSTRSPTRTRMRWYSYDPFAHVPKEQAPSPPCGPGPRATTSRSAPTTRAASSAPTRAPTSASSPRRRHARAATPPSAPPERPQFVSASRR